MKPTTRSKIGSESLILGMFFGLERLFVLDKAVTAAPQLVQKRAVDSMTAPHCEQYFAVIFGNLLYLKSIVCETIAPALKKILAKTVHAN